MEHWQSGFFKQKLRGSGVCAVEFYLREKRNHPVKGRRMAAGTG